ncbi:MAG TPA: aminoacyl-tRNA hydrolase [Planctomycetes bacterium]|nr:aminoacyl-tRNA hydrolase [Planctomycetota bacterium]
MSELVVTPRIKIPLREFDFIYSRSSGPGGQNVNKVASRVQLVWDFEKSTSLPGAVKGRFRARFGSRLTKDGRLILASSRYRDQGRNLADCLERLRAMLLEVARPPKIRKKTRPTKGSVERRLREKKAQSEKKKRRKLEE